MPLHSAFYMQLALDAAWKYQLLTFPNPAVGAVVLGKHSEILSICAHKEAGKAHAEVLAFKEAYIALSGDEKIKSLTQSDEIHHYLKQNHNNLFYDTTLFVTLEPCSSEGKTPACSDLIKVLKPKKLYIGTLDSMQKNNPLEDFKALGIEVEVGLLKEACDALIEPFLAWNNQGFNLFKMALNLNGSYDTGIISSKASRVHVHHIRSLVSQLLIGGETVRTDRPRLDTRLITSKKNPDVVIFSKHKNFDKSIPLFSVPNRLVNISSRPNLERPFTLIEGGKGTFEALKDKITWILLYINGSIKEGQTLQSHFKGEILHVDKKEKDRVLWIRKEPV